MLGPRDIVDLYSPVCALLQLNKLDLNPIAVPDRLGRHADRDRTGHGAQDERHTLVRGMLRRLASAKPLLDLGPEAVAQKVRPVNAFQQGDPLVPCLALPSQFETDLDQGSVVDAVEWLRDAVEGMAYDRPKPTLVAL